MVKVLISLVLVLLVVGCSPKLPPLSPVPEEPTTQTPMSETPTPTLTPVPTLVPTPSPTPTPTPKLTPTPLPQPSSASDPDIEVKLVDRTWISPGIVQVGNYYPGARAEWNIRIHNGKDTEAKFLISYRIPDRVKEGYTMAPVEAQDWVIIVDPTPVLAPKETREILVVLAMPKEVKMEGKKWEFWVSMMEQTGGMVQTEMVSRWLVSMR